MSKPAAKPLLRKPASIETPEQLRIARKRAEVNATQDKLRLESSLNELKTKGPKVLLKEVVIPVAAVGVAVWGVTKLAKALTSSSRDYVEPERHYAAGTPTPVATAHVAPRVHYVQPRRSTANKLATYLPVAIKLAKMGVSYAEKQGHAVPPLVHSLLSGPGVSSQQRT